MKSTKTLKVRVKDKHAHLLSQQAKAVNFVWNYINELSSRSIKERGVFLSEFDLHPYTKGAGKELGLHSQTLQCVAKEYTTRRKQFKKARLNWRKSGGVKRSLGWVPFNTGAAKLKNGQVYFNKNHFKIWDSYGLSQYKFKSGSFNEDSRGRWYFNVVVEVECAQGTGNAAVGIDLGCKETATDSTGHKIKGREYRKLEKKLGIAQRAKNKKRVKAIHAKKNRRSDTLHKYSRKLVEENAAIFVGNISSKAMIKTKMAKSALDAGWGILKTMLEYKSAHAGIVFEVVNEAHTTVTCSCCKKRTGPRGLEGLRKREWICECGVTHDRDINSANNILAVGLDRLAEEKVAA
jgi:putative transposase